MKRQLEDLHRATVSFTYRYTESSKSTEGEHISGDCLNINLGDSAYPWLRRVKVDAFDSLRPSEQLPLPMGLNISMDTLLIHGTRPKQQQPLGSKSTVYRFHPHTLTSNRMLERLLIPLDGEDVTSFDSYEVQQSLQQSNSCVVR